MALGYKPLSLDSQVFLSFSDHATRRMEEQGTQPSEVVTYLAKSTLFTANGARDLNLDPEVRDLLRRPSTNPRAVALAAVAPEDRFSLHYYSAEKEERVDIDEVRWHVSVIEHKGNAIFTVVTDFFTDQDPDKKTTMDGVVPPFSKFKSLSTHARMGRVRIVDNHSI